MTTTQIIWVISIYILSFIRMYFWYRSAHGTNGIYEGLKLEIFDVLIIVLPYANTIGALCSLLISITGKEPNTIRKDYSMYLIFGIVCIILYHVLPLLKQ